MAQSPRCYGVGRREQYKQRPFCNCIKRRPRLSGALTCTARRRSRVGSDGSTDCGGLAVGCSPRGALDETTIGRHSSRALQAGRRRSAISGLELPVGT